MDCPTSETLYSPLLQHFPRNNNIGQKRCYCSTHMTNVNWAPGSIIKPNYFQPIDKEKEDFNTQSAFLVDLIGFIFFSIFLMFEFWIQVFFYAVRCINALKTADGAIQIATATSSLFILCSIVIQTIFHGDLQEVEGKCY